MRRLPSLLAVLFAVPLACGGGSGGGSGSAGGSDAGTTAVDAGTPPVSDAGTIIPPDDAGAPPPPATDAGATTPPADAGTPPAPDGGAVGPAPDAGTPPADGGTAANDCDGLAPPPVPAPVMVEAGNVGGSTRCMSGTSDGSGNLALLFAEDTTSASEPTRLFLFDRAGNALGTADGESSEVTEQLAGYIVVDGANHDVLTLIDASGKNLGNTVNLNEVTRFQANNPRGGIVIVTLSNTTQAPLAVENYDASLHLRWRVPVPTSGNPFGVVADRLGQVLVIGDGTSHFGSGTVAGVWIDTNGSVGSEFEVASGLGNPFQFGSNFVLTPRAGSGVFVQSPNGQWIAQVDSLAPTGQPPPAWLAARPNTTLHAAHNGTAYAVIDPVGTSSCNQVIETVSASGQSCGNATFGCTQVGGRTVIGFEGTVVQDLGPVQAANGSFTCGWQWYQGFYH